MKPRLSRTAFLPAAVLALCGGLALVAQDNKEKPKPWPERAAERFGDNPTDEHKKLIAEAIPEATAEPQAERKVLVFWRCEGFIHTSIPFGNHALEQIAEQTGAYTMDLADEYHVFTEDNLARYDAIIFNNTTHLDPDETQRAAILGFIESGKGIVGIHAAADNFGNWDEGVALIGGIFDGHPWTAGGTWAFKLDDPEHALNAAFKEEGFWHQDEIYWYKPENFQGRERLRVLLSLDMSKAKNAEPLGNERWQKAAQSQGPVEDIDVPVSWVREIGEGRLFFTNLGHNDLTFANTTVLQHLLDGIQYALGDIEADAEPSAQIEKSASLAPEAP